MLMFLAPVQLPEHFACENRMLEVSCPDGFLIKMTNANYGRQVSTKLHLRVNFYFHHILNTFT